MIEVSLRPDNAVRPGLKSWCPPFMVIAAMLALSACSCDDEYWEGEGVTAATTAAPGATCNVRAAAQLSGTDAAARADPHMLEVARGEARSACGAGETGIGNSN